ncbi:putative tricarboxylic transport membrane protein [Sinosporangium album]|uniref:Putative tricarboxylic transport membrane protein n=1 Tax=Sinosporangium album TaxID=504805 RepID=A0A1G8F7G7_9ACTN|nr:tripartite tricarboxylate transporter TctB family protein [Sinosporangium album]SDH78047.1 putative tricarboxylic transport membrane protein [Sinosporangium album]
MSSKERLGGAATGGAAPAPHPKEPASPRGVGRGDAPADASSRSWWRPELGLALIVLGLGIFVLVGTADVKSATVLGPGPRFFPVLVGGALVAIGVFYIIDVLRGGHGDPEEGEDVDSDASTDWRSLGLVSLIFLAFAGLLNLLGWVIASGLLFFGLATVLGARHRLRTAAISVILAFGSYLAFVKGLGVTLPAGLLDGLM